MNGSHHGRRFVGPSSDPRMLFLQLALVLLSLALIAAGAVVLGLRMWQLAVGVVLAGAGVGGLLLLRAIWSLWWAYAPSEPEPVVKVRERVIPVRSWTQHQALPAPADELVHDDAGQLAVGRFLAFVRAAYSSKDLSWRSCRELDLPGGRLSESEWRGYCRRLQIAGVAVRKYQRAELELCCSHGEALPRLVER